MSIATSFSAPTSTALTTLTEHYLLAFWERRPCPGACPLQRMMPSMNSSRVSCVQATGSRVCEVCSVSLSLSLSLSFQPHGMFWLSLFMSAWTGPGLFVSFQAPTTRTEVFVFVYCTHGMPQQIRGGFVTGLRRPKDTLGDCS